MTWDQLARQERRSSSTRGAPTPFTAEVWADNWAATSGEWSVFVVQRAPLNIDCEDDVDPDVTCELEIVDAPAGWTEVGFDARAWSAATVWTEGDVDPKGGYDEIAWDPSAELIWGPDLEVDNTILLLTTIDA